MDDLYQKPPQPEKKKHNHFLHALATIGLALVILVVQAKPSSAILPVTDAVTGVNTALTELYSGISAQIAATQFFQRPIKDLIIEGAVTASVGAANYFFSQLAYSAAVALTSECPGQKVCWDSKAFTDGFTQAWQGAVGDAIGRLGETVGVNLCAPALSFQLRIQLGLLDELRPPAPKCDFNAVISNWNNLKNTLTSGQALLAIQTQFTPGQAPLTFALRTYDRIQSEVAVNAQRDFIVKTLRDAAGGGGFSPITNPVSGRVLSPPEATRAEFQRLQFESKSAGIQYSSSTVAGQIASGAAVSVAVNTVRTFVQTIIARLWNKLITGLLSSEELIALQPDLVLNAEGILQPLGTIGSELAQTRVLAPPPQDIGVYDPLSDYTVCPPSQRKATNCVMDNQFAQAVRVADATPFTVRKAIDEGLLHGDWPLISSDDRAKDQDSFCYASGYCESNLKKLRGSRVISIGWEIAAQGSPVQHPWKLKDVVFGFHDCNTAGLPDKDHPYCHLIDPDWVLKAPPAQCRAEVYGTTLAAPGLSDRAQTCVDQPTCLGQDDFGTCTGGYGYCTRERNTWRFNGDSCPDYYNTCRAFSARTGGQQNFLLNTVDFGICNADNIGCKSYALEKNLTGAANDPADDWDDTPARFFNRNIETCAANDSGCTALFRLDPGQSLNLVRNGSFEETEDGDRDGSPDHAKFWTPVGKVPANTSGTTVNDTALVGSGFLAMRLGPTSVAAKSCASTSGTCKRDEGCTCTTADGFGCAIVKGQSLCTATNRVIQDFIPLRGSTTYTLSATFIASQRDATAVGVSATASGQMMLKFYNASGSAVTPANVSTSTFFGDGADLNASTCTLGGSTLTFKTVAQSGTNKLRGFCTFSVNATIAEATLELSRLGSLDQYVDDVQLEEGGGTPYHDGYQTVVATANRVNAKVAPSYLGCTGEDTDSPECAKFAGVCRENEIGCERYTPTNGDAAVPAIVSSGDYCPDECAGYDIYKQEAGRFDAEKFPVAFIPSTAKQCNEQDVGCSQFTNLDTEKVEYFSGLRLCQAPDAPDSQVFYSWEGSDSTGFQLRVWNFKRTGTATQETGAAADQKSDIKADAASASAGFAPCTKLNPADNSCVDADITGLCSLFDIQRGDFDCREFYDADGNRHFRRYSQTISATSDCHPYRITVSNQVDCTKSDGKWDDVKNECIYRVSAPESISCSAPANGCRAYRGNAAGNVQNAYAEDFEQGIGGWTGGVTQSPEAITVGGHSMKISSGATATLDITAISRPKNIYTVSFWARGTGKLDIKFADGGAQTCTRAVCNEPNGCSCTTPNGLTCNVLQNGTSCPIPNHVTTPTPTPFSVNDADVATPTVDLKSGWQQYNLGPVIVDDVNWGKAAVNLRITAAGESFIDNVQIRLQQDKFFVVRDSWKTPISCDQTSDGAPSPLEMIGCREYKDSKSVSNYLRSFTQLCREKAVGCQAYSNTQNNPANPFVTTFNAVCELTTGACNQASCPCDYNYRNAASLVDLTLSDVCRVKKDETECRFTYSGLATNVTPASHPDLVVVPADQRAFLVVNKSNECDASAVSCKVTGLPQQVFEKTCSLPTGQRCQPSLGQTTCACRDTSGTTLCTMQANQISCNYALDEPVTGAWKEIGVKDDPTKYERTLCTEPALSCEEFRTTDGTFYFKDPGNQVCEYRENASLNICQGGTDAGSACATNADCRGAGTCALVARSGWFRKSDKGVLFPCYDGFVKDGDFFNIRKNGDDNYDGWVGNCQREFDRCEEFVDPLDTAGDYREGKPYYYIVNSKIDLKSCGGTASLKRGCVLFRRTLNTQQTFASFATYLQSDKLAQGGPVTPVDCNADRRNPLCEKRCSAIKNGVCSGNGAACAQPDDCPTGQQCLGARYYANGCQNTTDCNASAGEVCAIEAILPTGGDNINNLFTTARTFTKNDANVVIKVRQDRECSQWLACESSQSVWDQQKGKWKAVCTSFGLCDQNQKAGESFECVNWLTPKKSILTEAEYAKRDVRYTGLEYSGYSIANSYPAQYVAPIVAVSPGRCENSNGVRTGTGACYSDSDCASGSTCTTKQGVCVGDAAKAGRACDSTDGATAVCGQGYCADATQSGIRYGIAKTFCDSGANAGKECLSNNDCDPSGTVLCGCNRDSQCPSDGHGRGECLSAKCMYAFDGGPLIPADASTASSCRGYPEKDAPFNASVVDATVDSVAGALKCASGATPPVGYDCFGRARKVQLSFQGVNTCTLGNDCDCSYRKYSFGQNNGVTRYQSPDSAPPANDKVPGRVYTTGICVGGSNDGGECNAQCTALCRQVRLSPLCIDPTSAAQHEDECNPGDCNCDEALAACGGEQSDGSCVALSAVTVAKGWKGYCIDRDFSLNVNGSQDQFACNLWLPVDQLAGTEDIYNQAREAGFQSTQNTILYCQEAKGIARLSNDFPASQQAINEKILYDDFNCSGTQCVSTGNCAEQTTRTTCLQQKNTFSSTRVNPDGSTEPTMVQGCTWDTAKSKCNDVVITCDAGAESDPNVCPASPTRGKNFFSGPDACSKYALKAPYFDKENHPCGDNTGPGGGDSTCKSSNVASSAACSDSAKSTTMWFYRHGNENTGRYRHRSGKGPGANDVTGLLADSPSDLDHYISTMDLRRYNLNKSQIAGIKIEFIGVSPSGTSGGEDATIDANPGPIDDRWMFMYLIPDATNPNNRPLKADASEETWVNSIRWHDNAFSITRADHGAQYTSDQSTGAIVGEGWQGECAKLLYTGAKEGPQKDNPNNGFQPTQDGDAPGIGGGGGSIIDEANNCLAVRVHFDATTGLLTYADTAFYMGDAYDKTIPIRVTAKLREQCSAFSLVYDASHDPEQNNAAPWTDRLFQADKPYLIDLGNNRTREFIYSPVSLLCGANGGTTLDPFGPAGVCSTGGQQSVMVKAPLGSDPGRIIQNPKKRQPFMLYTQFDASSGKTYGSRFATITKAGPGSTGTISGCTGGDPSQPTSSTGNPSGKADGSMDFSWVTGSACGGYDLPVLTQSYKFASGTYAIGYAYGCNGDCANMPAEGAQADDNGIDRISKLFARAYSIYNYVGDQTARDGEGYIRQTAGRPFDRRIANTAPSNKPGVHPADTSNCKPDGQCVESVADGMNVNGVISGDVFGSGGRLKVSIKYYAAADKDHLPLRRKVIDFGDGGAPLASDGFYKNHRGTNANGESLCDNSVWGTTSDSCDPRYFEEQKTYLCNPSLVATLPQCDEATWPCQREGACVYRPRVQVVDNWGVCNGSCSDPPGRGDVCIDEVTQGQECNLRPVTGLGTPSRHNPWTSFDGEIVVTP